MRCVGSKRSRLRFRMAVASIVLCLLFTSVISSAYHTDLGYQRYLSVDIELPSYEGDYIGNENIISNRNAEAEDLIESTAIPAEEEEKEHEEKEEVEAMKIEKECEEQMKEKVNSADSSEHVSREVAENEKQCFFECVFQKNKAADSKGNIIEKQASKFIISTTEIKDKTKLTKVYDSCLKKVKERVTNDKKQHICNPAASILYHCIYEDFHMPL
ncbi:uncharacterized protein [Periplaneta americana]|uniref:uncharacterized protein isoform X2 n=1 Tax=Periplaneta americana TaxID=6978 RepID=UPI0037E7A1DD